jgi:glycosyltransferase involved in cell wall biosynthesis
MAWSARAAAAFVKLGGKLLVPDPQVLWLPAAHRILARRLRRLADDVVFISGPPFSQFWLAPMVRLRRGAAVVLDYRDEWRMASRSRSSRLEARLESRLLRCADAVTTATSAYRSELCDRHAFLDPARVCAIPNGYDPGDFQRDLPRPGGDRFVLTYVGTVFSLTTARWLIDAVRALHAREPELARLLTLRFVGRIVGAEARHLQGTEALGVEQTGYVDHDRAIDELARCHAAVCILDSAPGAERVYPAKIFEIMHLRKPCLVLAPDGALKDLVQRHGIGEVVAPRDVPSIVAALGRMLRDFRAGVAPLTTAPVDVEGFDRQRQAGAFADVFRAAAVLARGNRRHLLASAWS